MTSPDAVTAFIAKWRTSTLKERSAAQEHFIDLCRLLDIKTPAEEDPHGDWFTFEKGAKKTGGGDGWADVWRQHCFAWEYKGKHQDLKAALRQLQQYAPALDHPPLLIVSDMVTIEIHTAFTDTVVKVYRMTLDDLADPEPLQKLRWAFTEPDRLKPSLTRQAVTETAATVLGSLAQRLRERGHDPQRVAHFMTRLLFCLFAEDIDLLPNRLFSKLVAMVKPRPALFVERTRELFALMQNGGWFGLAPIAWFNGGLFNDADCLPLDSGDLNALHSATTLSWAAIEPAIFGTLFERGLDPAQRGQLGAHYTDAASIRRLIDPVIRDPLRAEWAAVKAEIATTLNQPGPDAFSRATVCLHRFLDRLRGYRVLDPACGSGNFLYLALRALKDLEHQVLLDAQQLGLPRELPKIGPDAVLGLEINPYAAELARVTVWIGEIQWMLAHGYPLDDQPILKDLNTIECRDALLTGESEATWPVAEAIVGNPPFLGGSKLLRELGDRYAETLRRVYAGRVPGGADLVCYWFEKARAQLETGQTDRAGLVATNSIRGGANRTVLDRIQTTGAIFHAWSDERWFDQGTAVRVSLIGFGRRDHDQSLILDGQPVPAIHADLTRGALNTDSDDLTQARNLQENAGVIFMGASKKGSLDIPGKLARQWLVLPNPHCCPNNHVLQPC
jgi:SAM-dependent methyltransferase